MEQFNNIKEQNKELIDRLCEVIKYLDSKYPNILNENTKEGRENINTIYDIIIKNLDNENI